MFSPSSSLVSLNCRCFLSSCQTFYCDAVAFHFTKVKGGTELVESIHSLLFKSKGKVSLLGRPLRRPWRQPWTETQHKKLSHRQGAYNYLIRSDIHWPCQVVHEYTSPRASACAAVNKEAGHHGVLWLCIRGRDGGESLTLVSLPLPRRHAHTAHDLQTGVRTHCGADEPCMTRLAGSWHEQMLD